MRLILLLIHSSRAQILNTHLLPIGAFMEALKMMGVRNLPIILLYLKISVVQIIQFH